LFVFQVALAVLADVSVARVAKLGRLHRELSHDTHLNENTHDTYLKENTHDSHVNENTHSFQQNLFSRKDVIVDIHEQNKDQYHEADCDNGECTIFCYFWIQYIGEFIANLTIILNNQRAIQYLELITKGYLISWVGKNSPFVSPFSS
jgi:hypothetical protein